MYYFILALKHFSITYLMFSVVANFAMKAIGHFLFEGDEKSHALPAEKFKFSIMAEFLMLYHALTGKLELKIVEACA